MSLGVKIIALLFLGVGVFLLLQVSLPLISYKITEAQVLAENTLLVSPQTDSQVLGVSIATEKNFPAFISNVKRDHPASYEKFSLTVPQLKIKQAPVLVDSNDLDKGPAHLPGSALPGEKGNVFISGHSALPQIFIGEKSLGSIFANLSNVKKGETITLVAGENKFDYKVIGIKIVKPDDLSVIPALDQNGRYLSLMTCVPPGFNTKRLVVLAKMEE